MRHYRKDIDGLRAIAVLPIVLYHAGLGFPGGFVGVDIFFVISGYLITSTISAEMVAGTFSIFAFYERRIRRIFPALFVMMCASAVAAWCLFLPSEFILFGKSVLATALFFSNFEFRREAGYFDAIDFVKPLLHTWSLAVEEQFYILFPVVLLVFRRRRSLQLIVIAALVVISLGVSQWWVIDRPVDAFYLLPARLWELGLGALLAGLEAHWPKRRMTATVVTTTGIVLIGLALFLFNSSTPFPGLFALVPCIGAALVIMGGGTPNPASRILSAPPLVFAGLISYSLYLWHWPIIVFSQYKLGHTLTAVEAIQVIAFSLVVATISWGLIEAPVRRRVFLRQRFSLLGMATIVMTAFCLLGFSIKDFQGFPDRLTDKVARIYAAKLDGSKYMTASCFTTSEHKGPTDADVRAGHLCSLGDEQVPTVSFAVWGDSHSGAMAPAIDKAAQSAGQKGFLIGQAGCPPLLDYETKHLKKETRDACMQRNDAALELVKTAHIQLIFLVARWPKEVLGAEYGKEGPYFDPAVPYQITDRSVSVSTALDKTLAALAQLHCQAVLVMDVPEPGYDVPYALARAASDHRAIDVNPARDAVDQRQREAVSILKTAAATYGARFIDPTPSFCDADHCNVELDGRPLYVDADHLTRSAALSLSGLFEHSFYHERQAVSADLKLQ